MKKIFVNYYDKAAKKAEDMGNEKLKEILINLKKWEERHVRLVEEMINIVFEKIA